MSAEPASALAYWQDRARLFAGRGEGLRAVCSYGMPRFYNRAIQRTQRRALLPWLAVTPGQRVLDVGCGVGRWSRLLAARGARVHGVDLSPAMVAEARRRAEVDGVAERCRFAVQDLARLELEQRFPLILGVTVLQHVLRRDELDEAIARLARHLEPGGRMVLLEAAPSRLDQSCDSAIFRARTAGTYRRRFAAAGLELEATTGVDPAPFKIWFLPSYARLPRPLALAGLALVTALGAPVDELFGRRWARRSWHKVFILRRPETGDVSGHGR